MQRLNKINLFFKKVLSNQYILYLLIFFAAFFAYLWIQSSPTFLDPDSFYHLKMAKMIAEKGPILNFPWLQFTVLKNYYIDHHFLYHILAIPFIKLFSDFAGFKLYTVILAALFIFLTYLFFKNQKIKYAEICTLILLFAPNFMYRISLAKASAFSLIILFLSIYFIFQRKNWLLAIISFIYVWSYGGFLLGLVMAIFYSLADSLEKTFIVNQSFREVIQLSWFRKIKKRIVLLIQKFFSKENLKTLGAVLLGIIFGLIINPYFPKNLKFYWQQLVQIGIINYRGAVNVGGEWYPYPPLNLISDSGLTIIFGTLALILFFIFMKKQNAKNIFLLIATIFFLFLTLKSKRYIEYFIPFLVYFFSFTITLVLSKINLEEFIAYLKKNLPFFKNFKFSIFALILIFSFVMVKDMIITHQTFQGGISFHKFENISKYLKENTQPGAIIMHTDWSDFPVLFYHNDQDFYIVGLDPTFMYNYDQSLYKLYADITMAKISDNLYFDIKDIFKASYFIVNQNRFQLADNLQRDGNFFKVYEDNDGSIYKVR